jgi:hypothetical protein
MVAYFRYGQPVTMKTFMNAKNWRGEQAGQSATPFAVMVSKATLQCGNGYASADICTMWLAFVSPQLREGWVGTGLFQLRTATPH